MNTAFLKTAASTVFISLLGFVAQDSYSSMNQKVDRILASQLTLVGEFNAQKTFDGEMKLVVRDHENRIIRLEFITDEDK